MKVKVLPLYSEVINFRPFGIAENEFKKNVNCGHDKLKYEVGRRTRVGLFKVEVQRKYRNRTQSYREYRRVERLFNKRFGRGKRGFNQSRRSAIQYTTWSGKIVKLGVTKSYKWISETTTWKIRTIRKKLNSLKGWGLFTWNKSYRRIRNILRRRRIRFKYKTDRHNKYLIFYKDGFKAVLEFNKTHRGQRNFFMSINMNRTFRSTAAARRMYNKWDRKFRRELGLPRVGPHTFSQHGGWQGKYTLIYLTREKRLLTISFRREYN